MMNPNPSANCYALIKHYEGCKLDAYLCPANIPTIGYGNTFYADGKPVKMGEKITKEQAEALLPNVVEKFAQSVNKAVKRVIKQHEFDALVSFTYNVGIGNLGKSTLLLKVNNNSPKEEIVAEFLKWNKAGGKVLDGLTKRRKSESYLYITGEVNL